MIFHFVVLNVIWICTAILFNGLFFYVGVLPGTPFANTYYTTLADIIAYVSIRASLFSHTAQPNHRNVEVLTVV